MNFDNLEQQKTFDLMTEFYATARERNVDCKTLIGAIITMIASEVCLNFPAADHDRIIDEYAKEIKMTIELNGAFDEQDRLAELARCKSLS